MMPVYVMRDGVSVDKTTGEPMKLDPDWKPEAPRTWASMPEYQSPVTGERIGDRRQREDDMKRHGCIDANDMRPDDAGKFRNPSFIRKHGLQKQAAEGVSVDPEP